MTCRSTDVLQLLCPPAEINAKGVILKAFEQYRLKTCIDFQPWNGEENYISIFKGKGYGKRARETTVTGACS